MAALTTWTPGSLTGVYTICLTVTDGVGNQNVQTATVYLDNTDRGTEPYYSCVPFSPAGGWDLSVNSATGEARVSRDLFTIPSYGPAQSLGLVYNSADSRTGDALTAPLGAGWFQTACEGSPLGA